MTIYHFSIHNEISIEVAWEEIQLAGIETLYSEEDEEGENKLIVCRLTPEQSLINFVNKFNSVKTITPAPDLATNWEDQWSSHGVNYYEGCAHLPLGGKELLLKAGPGFGDASHPTTCLVLRLMEKTVQEKIVLDIGCGSGILGLGALLLGASFSYAIDIDGDALQHAKQNAELNQLEKKIWIGRTTELLLQPMSLPLIGLMNMISSEQKEAWLSIQPLTHQITEIITSGILAEEQADYCANWQKEGWVVMDSLEKDGWVAFYLKIDFFQKFALVEKIDGF